MCWRGLKDVCLRGRQKTSSRRLHQDEYLLTKLYPIHWLKSNITTDGTTFPKSWNIKENYKNIKETSYLYQWCFSFASNSTGHALLFLLLLFFVYFCFGFLILFFFCCCCCFFETTKEVSPIIYLSSILDCDHIRLINFLKLILCSIIFKNVYKTFRITVSKYFYMLSTMPTLFLKKGAIEE